MYAVFHSSLIVLLLWSVTATDTGGTRGGVKEIRDENDEKKGFSLFSLMKGLGTPSEGQPDLGGLLQEFLSPFEPGFRPPHLAGGDFGMGPDMGDDDFDDWRKYFTNITCPAGPPDTQPPCFSMPPPPFGPPLGHGRPHFNTTGTWVCRTLYNPFTGAPKSVNRCIDSQVALTTDTCGCCQPDGCPKPCPCSCRNGKGVLVNVLRKKWNGKEKLVEMCLPPKVAVSVIAAVKKVNCSTSCQQ